MKSFINLFILCFFTSLSHAQDDFVIGMMGADVKADDVEFPPYGVPSMPVSGGYNTSHLNILSEDGFNLFSRYLPNRYEDIYEFRELLQLAENNGMQIMTNTKDWHLCDATGHSLHIDGGDTIAVANSNGGVNIYDGYLNWLTDYDTFFDSVYVDPTYTNSVWGHQLIEEGSFFNERFFDTTGFGLIGSKKKMESEVPLDKLAQAEEYFENKLVDMGLTHQELVIWEANHYGGATENFVTDLENNVEQYTAKHVLDSISRSTVYLEGSYSYWVPDEWLDKDYADIFGVGPTNRHHLGFLKSIDFAQTKSNSVHNVIGISREEASDHAFHSSAKKNYNWLWFKAYTSIIHGADGIWFWTFGHQWGWSAAEKLAWKSDPNRFARENFPPDYNNGVSRLVQELRYLSDLELLADDQNIIYTKTDHADPHCILPPAKDYIPKRKDLPDSVKSEVSLLRWNSEFRDDEISEQYGLRYTIRANGEDVIMIISNPLNIDITNVKLNFAAVSNDVIRNCDGVHFLFNDGLPYNHSAYKQDRDSDIDLVAGTVGDMLWKPIGPDRTLTLDFGPHDVHVLKFHDTGLPNYDNGWDLVWENQGSGRIGDWGDINDLDFFYAGDFDGDGGEELLCAQTSDEPGFIWMTMLNYNNSGNWDVVWSTFGGPHAMVDYRKYLQVGDFDGDGKDDLLANDPVGGTKVFTYSGGDFVEIWWADVTHPTNPYKDRFTIGDFNGDGQDEILGWDLDGSNWTTMFRFESGNWVWHWSDYGAIINISPYRWEMYAIDADGDGKDELLGFDNPPYPFPDGDVKLFSFAGAPGFSILWSSAGATDFGGWTYPIPKGDRFMVGNLDDVDSKEEIMIIQTTDISEWAATLHMQSNWIDWSWNWSANPDYAVPYIDTWPLDVVGSSDPKYFLFKPDELKPNFLVGMRRYSCIPGYKYDVRMYESLTTTNKMPNFDDSFQEEGSIEQEEMTENENYQYNFVLYPNPNDGTFNVQLTLRKADDITIQLMDMSGKVMEERYIGSLSAGNYNYNLSFNDVSNGIYILNLNGQNGTTQKKVMIK